MKVFGGDVWHVILRVTQCGLGLGWTMILPVRLYDA